MIRQAEIVVARIRSRRLTPSRRFKYSVHIRAGLNKGGIRNCGGESAPTPAGSTPKTARPVRAPEPAPEARTTFDKDQEQYVVAVVRQRKRWNEVRRTRHYGVITP